MRYDLISKYYTVEQYKHIKLVKECGEKYEIYKVWKQTDKYWKDTKKGTDIIYNEEPIHYEVREKGKYCQMEYECGKLESAEKVIEGYKEQDKFNDGLNTILLLGFCSFALWVIINAFSH